MFLLVDERSDSSCIMPSRNPDLPIDPETGEPIEAEAPNEVNIELNTTVVVFLTPDDARRMLTSVSVFVTSSP